MGDGLDSLFLVTLRPDRDSNPGLKIRNLKGYPLPYRGIAPTLIPEILNVIDRILFFKLKQPFLYIHTFGITSNPVFCHNPVAWNNNRDRVT